MKTSNVLIVDDDRDVADTLAYIIRRSGYNVTVAYDGENAIRVASQQIFDFGFIDFMLPGMDGSEFLEELRQLQPGICAYIMTSYGTKRCKARALEAGAREFLHKPVMPEDILGKLSRENAGTILIADDDPIFAEIISSTLETAGWRVRTAENGLQTVDIVSRGGIAALVLDVSMPILDGVEVCEELARRGKELPILVVTSSDDSRAMFEADQIVGYLTKPVDPRQVLHFIETALAKASEPAAA